MIENYLTESGEAILAKIGWPEWQGSKCRKRLGHDEAGFSIWINPNLTRGWVEDSDADEHVAICILRNFFKEKLAEKSVVIIPDVVAGKLLYRVTKMGQNGVTFLLADDNNWLSSNTILMNHAPALFDDEDLAIIAAVNSIF